MTINTQVRTAGPFAGNGVAATFPFQFKVFQPSDLLVFVTIADQAPAKLALDSDYSVTMNTDQNANPGGSIKLLKGPLATGSVLDVTSNVSATQPTELTNQGGFFPKVIESALDRLTILLQQLGFSNSEVGLYSLKQVLRYQELQGGGALPLLSNRRNKLLSFDDSGNPVASLPTSDSAQGVRVDLAAPGGSDTVGYLQAGQDSVPRTIQDAQRDIFSLFGAFTKAQVEDVRGRSCSIPVGARITAALSSSKTLGAEAWAPPGTYNLDDGASVSGWAGARIRGAGTNNTIFRKTTAGDMLRMTGCSRGAVSGIAFSGAGMPSGDGLVMDGEGSGVMKICANQFADFPGRGLFANFESPGSSSNLYEDNLFLANGLVSGTPQAEYRYCNDSVWARNQYGNNSLEGPWPSVGAHHYECKAGDFGPSNYHWENIVGATYENCDYSRFFSNRWETNQREGLKFLNTLRCSFVGNHIHSNSMESSGVYDGMVMQTCGRWTYVGNKFYTFNASKTAACLRITPDCNSIAVIGNEFFDFAGDDPVVWSSNSFDVIFSGNLPSGYGLDQSFAFQSPAKAKSVPGGQTVFAGLGAQSFDPSDVSYVASRKCVARLMQVNLSVAPGLGQAITVTLQKNGADTLFTTTIGGGTFFNSSAGNIKFDPSDTWNWKVVSSSGAATSTVTINVAFDA